MSNIVIYTKVFEEDGRNKNKSKKHNLLSEETLKTESDFKSFMKKWFR